MHGLPDGSDERPRGSILPPIAIGIAVAMLVRFGVHSIQVESGEPWVLRWLRIVAEHPVRTALATCLACVALRPRAASP